ncbi:guanine nucleotide binding protein, alpha subunit [Pterulicium gracile]|uniref:Guanine nucleotide binding protein, alpha subunit n=1 Tax=Pterulicium gracile TaxID=1884261 RepID=A0A5C3QNA0_9AGAR|nr:guanine nucleotide binding protein, alpha subunit [Pterula gracilis]
MHARREWSEERLAWRSVIQLNLVRMVNQIVDAVSNEISAQAAQTYPDSPTSDDESEGATPALLNVTNSKRKLKFSEKHRVLRLRLGPLRTVESDLQRKLGTEATELYSTDVDTAAPFEDDHPPIRTKKSKEFAVNSSNGWKTALGRFRSLVHQVDSPEQRTSRDADDDATNIIASLREDIVSLWEDPVVKELLHRRKTRIEDSPGFFLNDIDRIARLRYGPTDHDIIRARLRTVGVQEYRMTFEHGPTAGQEWWFFDVGGTRSSRTAWYPFFDDADAIVFLAPISCFDEKLAEDRRVNRLEDSYLLWRSVCSCKLLTRTQLIVFLNKCDLLQAKLTRGVRIKDHVPSYGDRRNDVITATRYFQQHFKEISKTCSPVPRPFFVHHTSVIDTKSTAITLGAVEESILRDHLRRADLM